MTLSETSPPQAMAANLAALRRGETHIWGSFTEDAPDAEKLLLDKLSETERVRAAAISLSGQRFEFVLAHALVRVVLSQYHATAPAAWQFGRGPQGKPFISAPSDVPPLQFNSTHTRGLAACAVTLAAAVGVDAEHLEPEADLPGVARQFLPAAARELEHLSGEQQTRRFYEYWTLHEARSKALGAGLAPQPLAAENAGGWQLFQRWVSPKHILAAVCRGQKTPAGFKVRIVQWQWCDGRMRLEARDTEGEAASD